MTNIDTQPNFQLPPAETTSSDPDHEKKVNRITDNLIAGMAIALRTPPTDQTSAIDNLKKILTETSQNVEPYEIFQRLSCLQKNILTRQIEASSSLEQQLLDNSFQPVITAQAIANHSRLIEITTPKLQAIIASQALIRDITPTQ